jgi:hypothetical protein
MTRLLLGLTTLPYYGPHPGTVPLAFIIVLGLFAGGLFGGAVMLVAFGALYLYGAWERGDGYLRLIAKGKGDE